MKLDELETLSVEDNLTAILSELFQGHYDLEEKFVYLQTRLLTCHKLLISLIEENKDLRDRLQKLEGGD